LDLFDYILLNQIVNIISMRKTKQEWQKAFCFNLKLNRIKNVQLFVRMEMAIFWQGCP
jgi:hypothetical protein